MDLDIQEILKRVIKYLIEGAAVALAMFIIPKKKLPIEEVLLVALSAALIFALLDAFSPAISDSARTGAGFGLGANLVGFPV